MTQFVYANNVNTTLASAVGSTATTVTLASSANLPTLAAGQVMPLTLNDAATGQLYEIVYVTAINGPTLTVQRAQEGTGAQNWNTNDYAYCAFTAQGTAAATGNPSNAYMVGPATATNQAPQASQIQQNGLTYAADTGAANAYAITLTPAPTLTKGAILGFTAAHANTGASTLAVNGGTAYPIWGAAHSPIQGGEIALNGYVQVEYNPTLNSGNPVFILLENTGGATQVSPATASQHAVQFAQVSGIVGQARNLNMSVTTASATATLTADEIIVETALGGLRYCLGSFSQTINLATTGAGGMDTGSAPASGYVALYAIYNPTTNTRTLLATNATNAVMPNVYGAGNMPSGYTASALVSVWPTNSSGQFVVGEQIDRDISTLGTAVLSTSAAASSFTALNIAAAVPKNAIYYEGTVSLVSSSSQASLYLAMTSAATGNKEALSVASTVSGDSKGINVSGRIRTPQTIYYSLSISGGTLTATMNISMYRF